MTIYINCMKYRAPTPGFEHDNDDGQEGEQDISVEQQVKKNQRLTCPFSVIFKKIELIAGNKDNKYLHPACTDNESAEALSQGGGIGVYYLAKFRAIHNHPLEACLMDNNEKSSWRSDPSKLLRTGARYIDIANRYPAENAVFQKFKAQAKLDLILGHIQRR